MTNQFKYSRPIEVQWRDIDALRHVNNAVYLSYFETARGGYLNDMFQWDWNKHGIILARASVEYKIPVLLTDRPRVHVRCSEIGRKSLTLQYLITVERNGKQLITTTSESVLVMFDYATEKTFAVPDELRARFAAFEQQEF